MRVAILFILALLAISATAEIYFEENFTDGDAWKSRWVVSDHKKDEGTAGEWVLAAGEHSADVEADKGLKTSQDARFYAISTKFPEFSSKGKTTVIQFSVKNGQNIDCGGGYLKLLPAGLDQSKFNGDSAYNIMFGPDICGSTRRTHVIFNYNGDNKLIKNDVRCESDVHNHVYTLIVKPDGTFEVLVDNQVRRTGKIEDEFDMLPPRKIPDPSVSKPADWIDEPTMDDPEDVKPADWDSIPATIPDPEAAKPEDWDDESDGVWEAPTIANPEYKGEWKAKKIPNPAYKGPWVQPTIDNPEYKEDLFLGQYDSNAFLGIEIWQVKSGTVFDNFLITDEVETAKKRAEEVIARAEKARKAYEAEEEEKRKEAQKAAEAAKAQEEDDNDEDDDSKPIKDTTKDEL